MCSTSSSKREVVITVAWVFTGRSPCTAPISSMYERGKAGSIGSGIGCDEITSRRLGAAVRDIETRANIASYPWAGQTWRQIGSGRSEEHTSELQSLMRI